MPELEQDRFQRAIFNADPLDLRQDGGGDDLAALAVLYAIREHGGFQRWLDFYRDVLAGSEVGAAFEETVGVSLSEFYDLFETWADHEHNLLQASAFATCAEAGQGLHLRGGTAGIDAGYPDYRVPTEDDHDGDGLVCEGFTPLGDLDRPQ